MLCCYFLEKWSKADDYDVIGLKEVYIDYTRFFPHGYDSMINNNGLPNKGIGNELDLNMNLNLAHYLYWDNKIHSRTDVDTDNNGNNLGGGQFRVVGLEMRLGVNVTENLQLGYYHHSQHWLDLHNANEHFPIEDGIQLRLFLFKSKGENSLF